MKHKDEKTKRRINRNLLLVTAVFLALIALVVFILIITNPYKDRSLEKSVYGFVGNGTEKKPYLISNADDLCHFRDLVNSGHGFSDSYFLQTNDIDLAGIDNWIPIGDFTSGMNSYFCGYYNGDGHTISNLTSIGTSTSTDAWNLNGMFGILYGEVRNLGIESGYIEGLAVGAVASHGSDSAAIINCYNKATVHGTSRAGGIVDSFQGRVSYCWNFGEVISDEGTVGGIASAEARINNCYSYKLPIVSDIFAGSVKNSKTISSPDEVDLTKIYETQYNEEAGIDSELNPADRIRYIVKNGDTVAFDRKYTPSYVVKKNISDFLADYGAFLLLGASALVFVIIIIRKPAATGTVLTIVLICGSLLALNNITMNKVGLGIYTMPNYYKQPEGSVDVLLLGSSRIGMNQDCETLWEHYGISGYALWGTVQPAWNSYYFLNEALKCGTPEVVVFDVVALYHDRDDLNEAHIYDNTYKIKLSTDKFEAVQASAPQEEWLNYMLGFPLFHTRYSELAQSDFELFWGDNIGADYKTQTARYGTGSFTAGSADDVVSVFSIPPEQEEYLIKIIDRCNTEDIPLVLVASNMPDRKKYQPYFNYIAGLAAEYDVPFVNYNLLDDETGFTDLDFWIDGHLNTNGARKQSDYLGKYLKEHYNLTDHRGDPYYSSWNEFSISEQNHYIPKITDISDYLKELVRDDKTVVIIKQSVNEDDPAYNAFLQNAEFCGFDMSFLNSAENGCWVVDHPMSAYENTSFDFEQRISFQLGDGNLVIDPSSKKIFYANVSLTSIFNGITCIVYDPVTKQIIDKCVIVPSDNGVVSHI